MLYTFELQIALIQFTIAKIEFNRKEESCVEDRCDPRISDEWKQDKLPQVRGDDTPGGIIQMRIRNLKSAPDATTETILP